MNTTDALIGVSVIGFGVLIGYSAYRNVPVFGPAGILTEAIQTGKLQAVPASGTPNPSKGVRTSGG
jgi:hypothetical protein